MASPNHYEILGLPATASLADIENRYRELARLYSLDGPAPGEGMASLIAEAFRVLGNPSLRAVYDSTLAVPNSAESGYQTGESTSTAPAQSVLIPDIDRTQQVTQPSSAPMPLDRTVKMPRPEAQATVEDKQLAAELARRGISPDEVRRLVGLGKEAPAATTGGKPRAPAAAPVLPPSPPFVPRPTIDLPAPRDSTTQERMEADRLLTAANIARRRGNFREAEASCRQAIDLIPSDSTALEMYGDVLQATGRVDDAALAYKRASEIDPARNTAEKKYGDLVLRQDRSIALIQDDAVPGNPHVAVLMSAVFPGAGQMYNGEAAKGLVVMAAFLLTSYVIFYTPFGIPHQRDGITTSLAVSIAVASLLYLYAVVDANLGARRGRRRATGWEV